MGTPSGVPIIFYKGTTMEDQIHQLLVIVDNMSTIFALTPNVELCEFFRNAIVIDYGIDPDAVVCVGPPVGEPV